MSLNPSDKIHVHVQPTVLSIELLNKSYNLSHNNDHEEFIIGDFVDK